MKRNTYLQRFCNIINTHCPQQQQLVGSISAASNWNKNQFNSLYTAGKLAVVCFIFISFSIIILYNNLAPYSCQAGVYVLKFFISFVIFNFIFNKFKYSNNLGIRFIQKCVLYYICLLCINILIISYEKIYIKLYVCTVY